MFSPAFSDGVLSSIYIARSLNLHFRMSLKEKSDNT